MSAHWRLALGYAAWVLVGAVLVGVAIWLLYGGAYGGAFMYGVGVGVVSFVSTALTVSLMTGGAGTAFAYMVGVASFGARYCFVAVALGVPAYFGLWPVLAMVGGFAGVYLSENIVIVLEAARSIGNPGRARRAKRAARSAGGTAVSKTVERRAEV